METTIALDDALLAKTQACAGLKEESRVIHEGSKPSSPAKAVGGSGRYSSEHRSTERMKQQ